MQTAEFVVVQGIDHESAFNWWVKHMLKERDKIIASFRKWQTTHLKKSHNFGTELSKTVEEALAFNDKKGKNLWASAIFNKRKNVRLAFKVLPDGKPVSIGNQYV